MVLYLYKNITIYQLKRIETKTKILAKKTKTNRLPNLYLTASINYQVQKFLTGKTFWTKSFFEYLYGQLLVVSDK